MVKMDTNIKNLNLHDIDLDRTKASKILKIIAEKEIGFIKNKKNEWYNKVCCKAVEKRKLARDKCCKIKTQWCIQKEWRNCRYIFQRKKRNFLNELLEEAVRYRLQGNSLNFFKLIKKHQQFNSSIKAI